MQKWHEIRYNKDSRAKSDQHFLFSMTCSVTMKKILLQLSFQGYWFYSEGHLEWIGVSVMLEPLKFSSVCLSIKQCIFRGRKKIRLIQDGQDEWHIMMEIQSRWKNHLGQDRRNTARFELQKAKKNTNTENADSLGIPHLEKYEIATLCL